MSLVLEQHQLRLQLGLFSLTLPTERERERDREKEREREREWGGEYQHADTEEQAKEQFPPSCYQAA